MDTRDPRVRAAFERIPELEQLVGEVDRSLIEWSLSIAPLERVRILNERARQISRFHVDASEDR